MDPIQIIKSIIRNRTPEVIDDVNGRYRHAAVLIPLFADEGEYKVLLTKRTDRVDEHKGQISFPGGSVDRKDNSYEDTALREAHEEIGLLRKDVTILGRIDDMLTLASNFIIHPVVGVIPYPYDFTISDFEVERIIRAPLNLFAPDGSKDPMGDVGYRGVTYHSLTYDYKGDIIWGATARIMETFMEIINGKIVLPELNR